MMVMSKGLVLHTSGIHCSNMSRLFFSQDCSLHIVSKLEAPHLWLPLA